MLFRLIDALRTDWKAVLRDPAHARRFAALGAKLAAACASETVFPPQAQMLRAFDYFDAARTKAVILGQDPYHGPGQANGLAFGIGPQAQKTPPSLANVARELEADVGAALEDPSLEKWAKQNVLLLNANLSVAAGKPLSHAGLGWDGFVAVCLEAVLRANPDAVFVCWGAWARRAVAPFRPARTVFSAHPSPLSAAGFLGSKPFSRTNRILVGAKQSPIK